MSSHWLYHAFDSNSIEFVNLTQNTFFRKCISRARNFRTSWAKFHKYRVWKRMTRVKHMLIDMSYGNRSINIQICKQIQHINGFQECTRLKQLTIVHPNKTAAKIWQKLSPIVLSNNGNIKITFECCYDAWDINKAIAKKHNHRNKLYLNQLEFTGMTNSGDELVYELLKNTSVKNEVEKVEFNFNGNTDHNPEDLDLCHIFFLKLCNGNNYDDIDSIVQRRKRQVFTKLIFPDPIWSEIDSREKFAQVGIVCGVDNKCDVGWEIDYPCETIIKVRALSLNEKNHKVFLHYGSMHQCFTNEKCKGGYHQLPNNRLHPPPAIQPSVSFGIAAKYHNTYSFYHGHGYYNDTNNDTHDDNEENSDDHIDEIDDNSDKDDDSDDIDMMLFTRLQKLNTIGISYKTPYIDFNAEWIIDALNFIVLLNTTCKSMRSGNSDKNIVGLDMNVEIPGISGDSTTWNAMENIFNALSKAICAKIPLSIRIVKKQILRCKNETHFSAMKQKYQKMFQNSKNNGFRKYFENHANKNLRSTQHRCDVQYKLQVIDNKMILCLQIQTTSRRTNVICAE